MSVVPRTLRGRLALWATLSTVVTLVAFAGAAYALVVLEQSERANDPAAAEEVAEDREQLLIAMAIAAPFSLLVSVGGAVWLTRRALAPLDAITREMRTMGTAELRRRIPVPTHDDELRALAIELNGLLERLDEGFRALGNYAANASHELRTPLAVITSELEVALRRPRTPDEWREVAGRSLDELGRLTRLVEALLRLSSGEHGRDELEVFALDAPLARALRACADEARAAGVELVGPDAPPIGAVRGDAALLASAFEELVRNALRYTPRGGNVRVRCASQDDRRVAVHVDDSGPGVHADARAKVFLPFSRGPEAREADARAGKALGVGLGLSIAKLSVERCGGELHVDASPEGGARFTTLFAVTNERQESSP